MKEVIISAGLLIEVMLIEVMLIEVIDNGLIPVYILGALSPRSLFNGRNYRH